MADDPATRIALALLVLAVALAAILLTLRRSKRRTLAEQYRRDALALRMAIRYEDQIRALGGEPQRNEIAPDTPR